MSSWVLAIAPTGLGSRERSRLESRLGALLGATIEVRSALTYGELLDSVVTSAVHLAWLGPALYVRARATSPVVALARTEREGSSSYRGAIFVRAEAPLHEAADLEGARIAWVDPSSCAGYLYARVALERAGLVLDRLGTERFVGSYGAVVRAVETRAVEAGAGFVDLAEPDDPSSAIVRAAWTDAGFEVRTLLFTSPVPADVVVATRKLPDADRASVTKALLELDRSDEGASILAELFHASALRDVTEDDYAPVHEALVAAGEKL